MSRRANNGGKTFVWTTRAGSYRSRTRVEKYDFVYIYIYILGQCRLGRSWGAK